MTDDDTNADGTSSGSSEEPTSDDDAEDRSSGVDPFQIESRLMSHGIYVSELEGSAETGFDVTYESMISDEGVITQQEVGRVITVFRDVFGEDWQGARIDGTICALDGDPVATWHCEQAWLADLATGDLSEVEFSRHVVDTLGPVEE